MVPSLKNDGPTPKCSLDLRYSQKNISKISKDKKSKTPNINKKNRLDNTNSDHIVKSNPPSTNPESDDPEKSNSNDSMTESLSFSGKHRLRISKACDLCRKKKTKCNGLSPCSNCIKIGLDCIYDMTVPKRKQRPVPKLSSIKKTSTTTKGIIKDMDNKINRLEFLLSSLINNVNKNNNANKDNIFGSSSNPSSYPINLQNHDYSNYSNSMVSNPSIHSKDIYKGYIPTIADDNTIHISTGMLSHSFSDSESSGSDSESLSDDDYAGVSMKNCENENSHEKGANMDISNDTDKSISELDANHIKKQQNYKALHNRSSSAKIKSEIIDLDDGTLGGSDDIINDEDFNAQTDADTIATNNHPLTSNMEIFSSKLSPLVLSQKCFKWAGEKAFKLSKGGPDGHMLKYSFQKSVFAFRNHFRKQLMLTKESNQSALNNPFDLFPDNSFIEKLIRIFSKVEMFETFLDSNDLQIITEKFYSSRLPNSKKKLTTGEYLILTMVCAFSTYLLSVGEEKVNHCNNKAGINKTGKTNNDEANEKNEARSAEDDSANVKSNDSLKNKPISAKEMKGYEQMFFRFALTLYQKAAISTASIDCVKGILLVALYFEGCSLSVNHTIISTGVRICEELNLHLLDSYKHLNKYEMLKRKMIWLIFYILDKNACMLTLKPPAILEKYSTTLSNEDFKLEMIKNFSMDGDNRQYFQEKPIDFYVNNDYEFMKEFNRYCLHNEYGFRYLSMFSRMIIAGIEQKMYDVLLSPTSTIKTLMKKTMDRNLTKEIKLKIFQKIQQKFDYLNKKLDDCESLLSIYGPQDSNRLQDICKITSNYPCSLEITTEYRKCALMTFYYWYHSNRMNLNRFGSTLMWIIEERRYQFSELAIDSALIVLKLCTRYYDLFLVLKNCFTLYILSSFFTIVTHVINLIYIESKKKNPSAENQEKIIQYVVQLILTELNYFETIDYVEDSFKDHIKYWTCRMIIICLLLLKDDKKDDDDGHINLDNILKNVDNKENYRDILQKFLNNNESFCENYVINNFKKVNNERDKHAGKQIQKENGGGAQSEEIRSLNAQKSEQIKVEAKGQNIQTESLVSQSCQDASLYPSNININYVNSYNYGSQKSLQIPLQQQSQQKQQLQPQQQQQQQKGSNNYQPQPILINQMQQQHMLHQEIQQQQIQQQFQQLHNQYNPVGDQQQMYEHNPTNGQHQQMLGVLTMQQQQSVPSQQHVQFSKGGAVDMKNLAASGIPYQKLYLPNDGKNGSVMTPIQHQRIQQVNSQQFFSNNNIEYASHGVQPVHDASGNPPGIFNFNGSTSSSDTPHREEYFGNKESANNAFEPLIFNNHLTTLIHGVSDDFANGNQEYYFYNMGNPETFTAADLIGNRENNYSHGN